MKKQLHSLVIIIVISFMQLNVHAQWQQTKGPAGGFVPVMHVKGDTLFAGNYEHYSINNTDADAGTLFRSTDHGLNWEKDSIGFEGQTNSFANNGNTIFVSTNTDGIYRSLNNGDSWQSLPNSNLFSPLHLLTLTGVIYVGTSLHGVTKSIDNGNTFIEVNNGLPLYASISALGVVNGVIFISGVDIFNQSIGIYKSTDQGVTWVQANGTQQGLPYVSSFATHGNKLFAAFGDGPNAFGASVHYTTDLGQSWIDSNTGIVGSVDWIKRTGMGDTLFAKAFSAVATEGHQLFKSVDNGANWSRVGSGIPGTENLTDLVHIGNELFVGLSVYGSVYKSTDIGLNFFPSNTNLANTDTRDIYFYGNKIFSASFGNASVHASTDAGIHWIPSGTGLPNGNGFGSVTGGYRIVKSLAGNTDYLFAGMDQLGVYRSSDTGRNWEPAFSGLSPFGMYINWLVPKGNMLFAGTYDDMFYSNDNGSNWIQGNAIFGSRREIRALVAKGNDLFAGIEYFGIYRSSDNGNSWTNLTNGLPGLFTPNQIIVRGNDLIAAGGAGIYISTDNGNSWTQKNNGLLGASFNCRTVAAKNDTLVTAIYDLNLRLSAGIWMSTDNGGHWIENDINIKPFAINRLAIVGNDVFAATATQSIWKTALSPGSVVPVGILNFTASPVNNEYVDLKWSVAEESNIRSYLITRAAPGETRFTSIGTVNATNQAVEHSYSFIDREVQKNRSYMYRLQVNEFSGSGKFSEIRAVRLNEDGTYVSAYPNPGDGNFKLNVSGYSGKAICKVLNISGEAVLQKSLMVQDAVPMALDLRNLAKGTYFIRLITLDKEFSEKIIIR